MQIKYNSLDNFFENMEQKNSEEIIAFLNELKVDNLCHNTLFQKAVLKCVVNNQLNLIKTLFESQFEVSIFDYNYLFSICDEKNNREMLNFLSSNCKDIEEIENVLLFCPLNKDNAELISNIIDVRKEKNSLEKLFLLNENKEVLHRINKL